MYLLPKTVVKKRRVRYNKSIFVGHAAGFLTGSYPARKMITVTDLWLKRGKEVVLKDVSFHLEAGETLCLLGPGGAGKSWLINALAGLTRPARGSLMIDDAPPGEGRKRRGRKVAVLLQDVMLPPGARVNELIGLFASLSGHRIDKKAVLADFDLLAQAKRSFASLSLFMKRKLLLALALLKEPDVLLIDELTTGLDEEKRRELSEHLLTLKKRGVTIIMTTRHLDDVETLADKIGILFTKRLIACGTRTELTALSRLTSRVSFTAVADIRSLFKDLPGVSRIEGIGDSYVIIGTGRDLASRCRKHLKKHDVTYGDLSFGAPTMEDVYLHLLQKARETGSDA